MKIIALNFGKWSQKGYINNKGKHIAYKRIKINKLWTPFIWVTYERKIYTKTNN